ncbi:MAG: LacI family DNA-binding transcriptional regulator [Oscillochloridaceae bacterium]|nr:LacI family transcriptional regulator [Chloroflexaceae bacterium]MDW8390313.1 LacI family DNA-binding transcriptional regulator [Oscillochloridaceae bacterium]
MATIKDVAQRARVSTATVSYVLNGTGAVTEATRQRVLEAVEALNYRPHHAARSLRTRARTLGLVLPADSPGLADPALAELVAGLAEGAAALGYGLLLASAEPEVAEAELALELVATNRVDGLVLLEPRVDDARAARLVAAGAPCVCAGPSVAPGCAALGYDLEGGAREATRHLLALGHRRIALIALPSDLAASEPFTEGYLQALASAGLVPDPALVIEAGISEDGGITAMQELLALPEPPTAVLAAGDALAFGAMHALRDARLAVGGDISLVGMGDLPLAAHTDPPLTTLRAPRRALGRALARRLALLVERRDDAAPDAPFGLRLIIRRTTAPPPRHG